MKNIKEKLSIIAVFVVIFIVTFIVTSGAVICYALNQVADQGLYECMISDNNFGIPSFTFDNAIMLADKYGFPRPINRNDVWWPLNHEGYKIRLAYIDAIINEIK